jgi:hypothetical protein
MLSLKSFGTCGHVSSSQPIRTLQVCNVLLVLDAAENEDEDFAPRRDRYAQRQAKCLRGALASPKLPPAVFRELMPARRLVPNPSGTQARVSANGIVEGFSIGADLRPAKRFLQELTLYHVDQSKSPHPNLSSS